jgi:hypothetical protein
MANQSGSYGYTRDTGPLFDAVTALVKEYLTRYSDRSKKVIEFHTPEEISQLVDLTLPEQGLPDEDIIAQCKAVMKYSVQTGLLMLKLNLLQQNYMIQWNHLQ